MFSSTLKIENSLRHGKGFRRLCMLAVLFLVCGTGASAVGDPSGRGARSLALGFATTAGEADAWSAFSNPALAGWMATPEFGVFYSPGAFGMSEFATGSGAVLYPFSFGVAGISFATRGFDLYRETTVGLTLAGEIVETISGGVTLNYHGLSIDRYGSSAAIALDVGLAFSPVRRLIVGGVVKTVNQPVLGESGQRLPSVMALGLSYRAHSSTTLYLDLEKDSRYPATVRFGIEHRPIDMVSARAGYQAAYGVFTAGIGIVQDAFSLDYAVQVHPVLSMTHGFSITGRF